MLIKILATAKRIEDDNFQAQREDEKESSQSKRRNIEKVGKKKL